MILILSLANKPALLLDALESVRNQTRTDYRHIVHLDGGGWPAGTYPPSVFANRQLRAAQTGDYVAWLSDDDVWASNFLETLAGFMDAHPMVAACYGWSQKVTYDPATGASQLVQDLPAIDTYHAGHLPSCRIDGGQVLFAERLLRILEPPWLAEGLRDCHISDGAWLNRIAEVADIVPVPTERPIMQNRITPLSAHWRLLQNGPQLVTAETVARLSA